MRTLITAVALAAAMAAPALAADEAKKPMTAQQGKMAACNKDAEGKKGDERKAFMKECLSNKGTATADAKGAQQEKMKTCNKEATGKTGDERKAFMKECLSK